MHFIGLQKRRSYSGIIFDDRSVVFSYIFTESLYLDTTVDTAKYSILQHKTIKVNNVSYHTVLSAKAKPRSTYMRSEKFFLCIAVWCILFFFSIKILIQAKLTILFFKESDRIHIRFFTKKILNLGNLTYML